VKIARSNPQARERRVLSRADHDFFRTPPEATAALLAREVFPGAVWEPACGDGAMVRPIEDAGYRVIATDLVDRGYGEAGRDFLLEQQLPAECGSVVTNPPFKLATQFVEHALDLGARKVAVLCRVAFLEGQARGAGIHQRLSRVWVFSRRITLWHGEATDIEKAASSGGAMAFAWFVIEREHRGPVVGFIP
jgi:hypothetical protein